MISLWVLSLEKRQAFYGAVTLETGCALARHFCTTDSAYSVNWGAGVMPLAVEGFLDHSRQADEQVVAFSAVGRSVHDGQSFRLKIGQRT